MSSTESILPQLAAVVQHRFEERPAGSYTAELFNAGRDTMAAKIIEEAYELVATTADEGEPNGAEVAHEAADLVYHVLVYLTAAGISWDHVERELQSRFGVSGFSGPTIPS